MNVALRLLLCLAAVLAGFPPVGMAADSCCTAAVTSSSNAQTPACGCCCLVKNDKESKHAAGCCQREHSPKGAKSAHQHEPVASTPRPCGQDNCPCSTQTCCAPVSLTLVFENSAAAQVQGVSASSPLQLREDLLQTRGDRPLVPPPKA